MAYKIQTLTNENNLLLERLNQLNEVTLNNEREYKRQLKQKQDREGELES